MAAFGSAVTGTSPGRRTRFTGTAAHSKEVIPPWWLRGFTRRRPLPVLLALAVWAASRAHEALGGRDAVAGPDVRTRCCPPGPRHLFGARYPSCSTAASWPSRVWGHLPRPWGSASRSRPSRPRGADARHRPTEPPRPRAGRATAGLRAAEQRRIALVGGAVVRQTGVDAEVAAVVERQADPHREPPGGAQIARAVNAYVEKVREAGPGGSLRAREEPRPGTARDCRPEVAESRARVLSGDCLTLPTVG